MGDPSAIALTAVMQGDHWRVQMKWPLNPKVNAIVALQDRPGLLAQARERDARLARGESMGPLHGFPQAVKDMQPVKGIRSTSGSPILRDFVPTADSIMVERLRKAGAIIIGKTNTPEFGRGSHTYNPVYGSTRNAYDQSRSAGGSSGGAAVALALRMLPVADGSDYGGSLRNPAGWNNVFGFRTSCGRVPRDARDVWLPSMSVLGPMARNVPDLAMLLSVQAGFDPRDPLAIEEDRAIFQQRLERNFKGTRVAWAGDFKGHTPCEPEAINVCKNAALRVFESIGCVVEEAVPDYPLEAVWNAALRLRSWQQGGALFAYYNDPAKRAMLKPEAILEIEMGLKLSAYDITAASVVRSEMAPGGASIFRSVRLLDRSNCTAVSVRRQSALAGRDCRYEDDDVSRMDESYVSHHHVRLSGAGCGRARIFPR